MIGDLETAAAQLIVRGAFQTTKNTSGRCKHHFWRNREQSDRYPAAIRGQLGNTVVTIEVEDEGGAVSQVGFNLAIHGGMK